MKPCELALMLWMGVTVLPLAIPSMTPTALREIHMPFSSGDPLNPTMPMHFETCTTMHAVRKLMPGHTDSVNCLSTAEHSSLLLSGSDDGTARAWDLRTLQCVIGMQARAKEEEECNPVNSVLSHYLRDHAVLLAAGPCVLEYDIRKPADPCAITRMKYSIAHHSDRLCGADITQMALNHAGTTLAITDEDGAVMLLDLGTRRTTVLTPHDGLASCLAWRTFLHPWCNHLLTGGADMKLRMHNTLTGKVVTEWTVKSTEPSSLQHVNPPFVHAMDVSADGHNMIVGAGDGILRVYELEDNQEDIEPPRAFITNRHRKSITCAAFPLKSPPSTCVTGSDDTHIKFWDICEDDDNVMGSDVLLDVNHGVKPNWVLCRSFGTSLAAPHFFVADVSNTISAYTFKL